MYHYIYKCVHVCMYTKDRASPTYKCHKSEPIVAPAAAARCMLMGSAAAHPNGKAACGPGAAARRPHLAERDRPHPLARHCIPAREKKTKLTITQIPLLAFR